MIKRLCLNVHPPGFSAPIKGRWLLEQKETDLFLRTVKMVKKTRNNPAWDKAGVLYLLGEGYVLLGEVSSPWVN